jgi:hypothetical protein
MLLMYWSFSSISSNANDHSLSSAEPWQCLQHIVVKAEVWSHSLDACVSLGGYQ